MKKLFKMFLVVALILTVTVGCASWKKLTADEKLTAGYITTGQSLVGIHSTWQILRTNGKVTDAQNDKFNDLFNKAKLTYKTLGDMEILIINTSDMVKKNEYQAIFNEAANKMPDILKQIGDLIVLIKGGK